MSNSREQEVRRRVIELLEAHYEEGLDEHGRQELNSLLRDHPVACDAYLSFTYLHGALAYRQGNGPETREDPPQEQAEPAGLRQRVRRIMRRPESLSIVVATAVIGLIISVAAYIAAPAFHGPGQGTDYSQPTVARLTGDHDARWAGAAKWFGSPLRVGQRIHLTDGLVEITYFNGTRVIVEGPVDYVVSGEGAGGLDAGKVTAFVPPEAIGFTIATPVGVAKDLGTEFGIEVREKDDASFAVFSGKIEVQTNTRVTAEPTTRVLVAGESLHVTSEGARFNSEDNMRDRFVRSLPQTSSELAFDDEYVNAVKAHSPIAYWRFESLENDRFRSEVAPHFALQREGRVLPFGEDGSNHVAAFRPRGVKSCLIGDAELTERLHEIDNEISIIAWVKTSSREHQALVHHWGGGGAFSLEIQDHQSALALKYPQRAVGYHLASGNPFQVGRWVMLAGVCDGREMRIYEDGELRAQMPVPQGASISDDGSPLHLGHRSDKADGQFAGGIDEVAIFNRALTTTDVERLYQLSLRASTNQPLED